MKKKKDETTHKAATPFARFQNLIRGIVAVPKRKSKLKMSAGAQIDG